jgi:hypothetical protein
VAHRIAQVLEISPWEALLLAVKRCAAWAAFYESKMAEVESDDALRPGGEHYDWVEAAERVNEKLARWSKMAVDAGVQAILVQQAQTEGARIVTLLNTAIAAAGLSEEAEDRLRVALRDALVGGTASLSSGTARMIAPASLDDDDEDADTHSSDARTP